MPRTSFETERAASALNTKPPIAMTANAANIALDPRPTDRDWSETSGPLDDVGPAVLVPVIRIVRQRRRRWGSAHSCDRDGSFRARLDALRRGPVATPRHAALTGRVDNLMRRAGLAQLVEHLTCNHVVASSTLAPGSNKTPA